ncbi:MAG: hypothetical protein ACXAHE_20400 [Roseburia sp. 1XD42-69]
MPAVDSPAHLLMYGKEASNRNKRQTASATLFRTKESEDQKTSIVEKSKSLDFPTNADCYGIPLIPT